MKLARTCIVVSTVGRARDFYRRLLELEPRSDLPEYVEFDIGGVGLALYDVRSHDKLAPGSARAGDNRSSMIEIEVDDVDREFRRLQDLVEDWVKPPATQPWGVPFHLFSRSRREPRELLHENPASELVLGPTVGSFSGRGQARSS
jgi:catechol 2,3-dioxygenase-like lactoylglutathione lyase family enzyme